ncbi:MAG: dicarboxylate/amino acid:cation symporter [Candidatus Sumerlaeia bacterium]|nr:dicarboxylate/amino acid:cation symporter [Candidatus Sumerlaeia bacterium]
METAEQTSGRKRFPLHTRIFIGLTVGVIAGLLCNSLFRESPALKWLIRNLISPFGQIFLRIIFMAVIPLIFSALALGVAELGDVRRLGRIGLRTFVYCLIITTLSVVIGISLVQIVRPGTGLSDADRQMLLAAVTTSAAKATVEQAAQAKSLVEVLLNLIPKNPFADAAHAFDEGYTGGGILALMVCALFVGVALALVRSERTEVFERFLQGLYDVVMKIIQIAMKLAPYGVACLVFSVVAQLGLDVIVLLGKYVAVVVVGLALQMFGVYSLALKYVIKTSPREFFQRIGEVILTAFSTSSSNATLPVALRVTQENLGVSRRVAGFVLTLGSTANQNGTALFEGVTVLFLAQFFGIELTPTQQVTVVLASVLAGIGTAGVPGGSLPVIVLVLQSVGVPGEGIGVILGVDRFLDMCRTTVNVTGDITAALYVEKRESNFAPNPLSTVSPQP